MWKPSFSFGFVIEWNWNECCVLWRPLQAVTAMSSCSCWRATRTWGRTRESCSCSAWLTRCSPMTPHPCARTWGTHTHTHTHLAVQHNSGSRRTLRTLVVSQKSICAAFTSIQRYAVIPLSTNSGLIGWVPHCDTLHALIRDYREKKKILLNIEHRIMLRVRSKPLSCHFYIVKQHFSSASALVYSLVSVRLTCSIEGLWKMFS